MVIVGEAIHIHNLGVENHSGNEGDARDTLECFHNGSNVRVLSFFAELLEYILIVFTYFFELEDQVQECKIACGGGQMQLLKPEDKRMRPSSAAGELERDCIPWE